MYGYGILKSRKTEEQEDMVIMTRAALFRKIELLLVVVVPAACAVLYNHRGMDKENHVLTRLNLQQPTL